MVSMFGEFDADEDGYLSRPEVSAMLASASVTNSFTSVGWTDSVLRLLDDKPTDGRLTYSEFGSFPSRFFSSTKGEAVKFT
jgi:Ca2+-binding EF-hand superfamily protein